MNKNHIKYFIIISAISLGVLFLIFNPKSKPGGRDINSSTSDNTTETQSDTTETESETQSETSENIRNFSESELWAMIDDISSNCNEFYRSNYEITRLISKDGFLYNKASENIMTLKMLNERYGVMEGEYILDGCHIMLLKPSDLLEYNIAKNEDDNLTIYVFYKDQSGNYMVSSETGGAGVMTQAQYGSLLDKYDQDHGLAGRRFKTDPYYNEIIDAIKQSKEYIGDYYVRYLASDNKYGCAVVSPKYDYTIIEQYILEKTDDNWKVVMDGLEKESRIYVKVNACLPGLNLEIIPNYTIANELDYMYKNFGAILQQIQSEGMSPSGSEIEFASGTDTYMFIKLKSGEAFYGEKFDDIWNVRVIDGPLDAEGYMLRSTSTPPLFILLQE